MITRQWLCVFWFQKQKIFFLLNSPAANIRLLFAMSYSGWIGAQWILKKTNAAGILGLFRYPRPQTRDESPSKNAAVEGKKSPIASDYFRSQKKQTVLRLCLSKVSTWMHYPLQTSDAELITACTKTVYSSQEIFSFWPQSTSWQVAESQHLPAEETEARRGSHLLSASLTCRSAGERRRGQESWHPLQCLKGTQLSSQLSTSALQKGSSLCKEPLCSKALSSFWETIIWCPHKRFRIQLTEMRKPSRSISAAGALGENEVDLVNALR